MVTIAATAAMLLSTGCEGDGASYVTPDGVGNNSPNVYLCIGDSITYGYGLSRVDAYPNQLAGMLQRTVINAGKEGERSWEGAARLGPLLERYKPAWCLILYGANDIIYGHSKRTIPNLQAMVNSCLANNTIPVIGTLTPAFGSHGYMEQEIRNENPRIREWAANAGVRVADLDSAFNWQREGYFQSDGLHPNGNGANLIALTFFAKIDQSWGAGALQKIDAGSALEEEQADNPTSPTMEFLTR
jgi:lysophospholipase L1-like esterase